MIINTGPIADIPNPTYDSIAYQGLVVPKMIQVRFVNSQDKGFDLERINKVINRYYQYSEYIISWYHESTDALLLQPLLLCLSFIPAIRKYRRKRKDALPPDMMSTGDLGIFVDLNHHIAVVDSGKLIETYPKYENLFLKYKLVHEKRPKSILIKHVKRLR
jgi:hypothetical protein